MEYVKTKIPRESKEYRAFVDNYPNGKGVCETFCDAFPDEEFCNNNNCFTDDDEFNLAVFKRKPE